MAMSIEQIQSALKDRNLREVSKRTGLNYYTLSRIRSGETTNPRYDTVFVLVEYLQKQVS